MSFNGDEEEVLIYLGLYRDNLIWPLRRWIELLNQKCFRCRCFRMHWWAKEIDHALESTQGVDKTQVLLKTSNLTWCIKRNHKGNASPSHRQLTKESFAFQNTHYKSEYWELLYGKQHQEGILYVSRLWMLKIDVMEESILMGTMKV